MPRHERTAARHRRDTSGPRRNVRAAHDRRSRGSPWPQCRRGADACSPRFVAGMIEMGCPATPPPLCMSQKRRFLRHSAPHPANAASGVSAGGVRVPAPGAAHIRRARAKAPARRGAASAIRGGGDGDRTHLPLWPAATPSPATISCACRRPIASADRAETPSATHDHHTRPPLRGARGGKCSVQTSDGIMRRTWASTSGTRMISSRWPMPGRTSGMGSIGLAT
jgi:hypothetical protein